MSNTDGLTFLPLDGAHVAFLLDARDDFETGLLCDWIEQQVSRAEFCSPYSVVELGQAQMESELAAAEDCPVWMQPLRVAWLPANQPSSSRGTLSFVRGLIGAPGRLRRRWLAKHHPERLSFVVGDGAYLEELRERYAAANVDADGLPSFIYAQALITLERAERAVRGARYKVPRILPSDIFANAEFRHVLANAAQQRDISVSEVTQQAARYLREMAATQTPFTLDLVNSLYRTACRRNHEGKISVDPEQLERVAATMAAHPVVFLISHKSMLDTAALSLVLYEADLPTPLTFGGINLNTPGLGALARRSGIIFLRRSFQDNEIYKATFRRYIDYLIEKRFSLLWALEGTRSRTGKLLPPRFGLFNYVVESILRTRLFDVTFVPVSVVYDQITEVQDYSTEQRGEKKKPEGAAWFVRFLKRSRSHGQIHLRFGDGITIRDLTEAAALEEGIDDEQKRVLVPTLAFEVAVRMNAVTPITATAILTLILLAGGHRAQTLLQIQTLARAGAALIRRRRLEIVGRADFRDADAVRATLEELHQTGIITYLDEGNERLYRITADQHHNAAYYRNTAIHYFVLDAFVEVALIDAASAPNDPVDAFFARTAELRELFKFEFYMPRRADYRSAIEERASDRFDDWRQAVADGPAQVDEALAAAPPLVAHAVLRSFVDAYSVAARLLVAAGGDAITDEAAFLSQCLTSGKQQLLQGRLFSAESVSKSLYQTAFKLAQYRNLLAADRVEARQDFHQELRIITERLDAILNMVLTRADE